MPPAPPFVPRIVLKARPTPVQIADRLRPVAQMRESRTMTSTVGGPPEHLARLADRIEGLRFTVDTSHAQLFLNAVNRPPGREPRLDRLCASLAVATAARDFESFLAPLR